MRVIYKQDVIKSGPRNIFAALQSTKTIPIKKEVQREEISQNNTYTRRTDTGQALHMNYSGLSN